MSDDISDDNDEFVEAFVLVKAVCRICGECVGCSCRDRMLLNKSSSKKSHQKEWDPYRSGPTINHGSNLAQETADAKRAVIFTRSAFLSPLEYSKTKV